VPEPRATVKPLGVSNEDRDLIDQHLHLADREPNPSTSPATMDALPAELRSQILSYISDLQDMKPVVQASTLLHQHYLLAWKSFLGRLLDTTLGTVLVNAYGIPKFASFHKAGHQLSEQDTRKFIGTYVKFRSIPKTIPDGPM
jgi:hypothetical protein